MFFLQDHGSQDGYVDLSDYESPDEDFGSTVSVSSICMC